MPSPRPRARKEALFVRVAAPDETVAFHNVSTYIGKIMPFKAPQATCAMRAAAEVVTFSLLHLTKRTAKTMAEKVLEIPKGPLAQLERTAISINKEAEITTEDIVVDIHGEGEGNKPSRYRMKLERDENGVLSIEMPDNEDGTGGDDVSMMLPRGAVRASLYMRSPGVGRLLAVGFIGHLGKPESSETVRRVAAMILFSLSQLTEFKVLSGIETVTVPANAGRYIPKPTRKPTEKALAVIPAYLFSESAAPELVAYGTVEVEVDLESANPQSNRLLLHLTPSKELEEHFGTYRNIVDATLGNHLRKTLGDDDIANITYDIVLGDVSNGTVEKLKEALEEAGRGFDFTPSMFQPHGS